MYPLGPVVQQYCTCCMNVSSSWFCPSYPTAHKIGNCLVMSYQSGWPNGILVCLEAFTHTLRHCIFPVSRCWSFRLPFQTPGFAFVWMGRAFGKKTRKHTKMVVYMHHPFPSLSVFYTFPDINAPLGVHLSVPSQLGVFFWGGDTKASRGRVGG